MVDCRSVCKQTNKQPNAAICTVTGNIKLRCLCIYVQDALIKCRSEKGLLERPALTQKGHAYDELTSTLRPLDGK